MCGSTGAFRQGNRRRFEVWPSIPPIAFARTLNEQFLRHQLTAFPITDEKLAQQAEESIRGAGARPTPLIKGPYLSLAKALRMGPPRVAGRTASSVLSH